LLDPAGSEAMAELTSSQKPSVLPALAEMLMNVSDYCWPVVNKHDSFPPSQGSCGTGYDGMSVCFLCWDQDDAEGVEQHIAEAMGGLYTPFMLGGLKLTGWAKRLLLRQSSISQAVDTLHTVARVRPWTDRYLTDLQAQNSCCNCTHFYNHISVSMNISAHISINMNTDISYYHSCCEAATAALLMPAGMQQWCSSTAVVQQYSSSTAVVQQYSSGAAVQQQYSSGAAVQQYSSGAAVQQYSSGAAVQQYSSGAAVQPPPSTDKWSTASTYPPIVGNVG
jgi:hypothetical protein